MNIAGTLATSVLVAALTPVALAGPAHAGNDDVIHRGQCSGSATWKLKASPQDGRIEVEGEIDTNRNGQLWRWQLWHNGSLTASGSRLTQAPSGSFEVRRVVVNLAGTDHLTFRARNPQTGQVCVGRLAF
jgi:hypothetical protein